MAYDANPLKEENQQVSPNVLSPQAQAQQDQMDAQTQGGPGQSATITPGQTAGASQPASQQAKDKPKSGMSANLRQYIQANRPQTQQITQAAQKDVGRQAESIGAKVQQQRQLQQQQVAQQAEKRQQANTFAQNLLKQASQTGQINTGDVTKFRDIATGKQTFTDVDDLDLTRPEIDAQRLETSAEQAKTAKGQADILRDTFSRQGRQYSRGQLGLDRLLLAGDEGARQDLQSSVAGGAEQAQSRIADARKKALQDIAGLESAQAQLQSQIANQAQTGVSGVQKEMQQRLAAQKKQRADLINRLDAEAQSVERYVKAANLNDQQIRDRIADAYMQTFNIDPNRMNDAQRRNLERMRTGQHYELRGDGRMLDQFAKTAMSDIIDTNRLRALGYNPEDFGTFDQGYGTNKVNLFGGSGSKMMYTTSHTGVGLEGLMREIRDKAAAYNRDQAIQQAYQQAGIDRAQFQSGADLTAANVATDTQRQRYNALRQLAGIGNQEANKILGQQTRGASTGFDRLNQLVRGQGGAVVDRQIRLPNGQIRRIIS